MTHHLFMTNHLSIDTEGLQDRADTSVSKTPAMNACGQKQQAASNLAHELLHV
jgi:hypothetical protein